MDRQPGGIYDNRKCNGKLERSNFWEFSNCATAPVPKPKPPTTLYGKRLRSARTAMGWTQAELARRIGMVDPVAGAARMSRYETGEHDPDPATAQALAKALGVPLPYFHATSEVLAEVIILVAKLPAAKQKEALQRLREWVGDGKG